MTEWRIVNFTLSEPEKVKDANSISEKVCTDCEMGCDVMETHIIRDYDQHGSKP